MSNNDLRDESRIKGFKDVPMKTFVVPVDEVGGDYRPRIIYEAYADTQDGQTCLATIYEYYGDTANPQHIKEVARAKWDGAWDTDRELDSPDSIVNGVS